MHGNLRTTVVMALFALAGTAHARTGTPPPGVERAGEAGRHALLIGIDHFEDDAFPELQWAEADAGAMRDGLEQIGFDSLTTITTDGAASRAGLLAELETFLGARGPDDTVLVYLSTHGVVDYVGGPPRRYLAARDTRRDDLRNTGVDVRELIRTVEGSLPRWKVLVLASCFGGAGEGGHGVEGPAPANQRGLPELPPMPLGGRRATVVLSASHEAGPAWEDPELGHEIYTHYLLDAFARAHDDAVDLDGDGALSAFEAHGHATVRTIQHTGGRQMPSADLYAVGERDVLLTADPPGEPRRGVFWWFSELLTPRGEGVERIWLDGELLESGQPVRALEPGRHVLEIGSPERRDSNRRVAFPLAKGEVLSVTDVLARAEDQWLGVEIGSVFVAGAQTFNAVNDDGDGGDPHDAPLALPLVRVSFEQRITARQRSRGLNLGLSVAWWPGRTYPAALGWLPARFAALDVSLLGERRLPRVRLAFGPFCEAMYLRADTSRAATTAISPGLRFRAHVPIGGRFSLRVAAQLSVARTVPFTGEDRPTYVLMPAVTAGVGVEL